jgi:titin
VLPALSSLLLAACGGGGGGASGETSGSTAVVESAPAAVTDVTAVASSDSAIVLSFKVSNPQNVTAFEAVCSGNGSLVTVRSASSGTATDTVTVTGLTNAPSASCTVSAINSSGASSASSPVQATAGSTAPTPSAPGVLSMDGASTSAVITFSESTISGGAAVSAYVGICVGPDKASYSYAAASPITVLGLTPDLPYTCWVSGLNAQGSGKASAASVVTPKAATAVAADAPAAPTGVSVARGAGSATVSFSTGTAAASASKRRAQGVATVSGTLYRATCRKGDNVVSVESTSSPITVPQLTNGAGYVCSVTVTTTAGTSADSTALDVIPSTVPDAPVLTALNAGDTTATLSFTAPAGDGGAAITRYHASCTSDTLAAAADASSAGTVVVAGLVNGSIYSCSVAAVNVAGTGAASNAMNVMPVASTVPVNGSVASAPQTVQASAANGSVVISFAAVTDSGSPVLDFTATCTAPGGQQVSTTGTGSPLTVSGLVNGSTYSCSVTARNENGISPASGTQSVTPAVTAPAAPTLVSVTPGDSAISVAFTAGSDGGAAVTAFTATCGDKTGSGLASPVTVSGLTNGQIYACSVTATNVVDTSASSDKRDTRPRTVPQKPTQVTATPGDTMITLAYVAAADNGGADILGYTASCKNNGTTFSVTSSASTDTSITVPGPSNGTAYDCTVTTNNTAGSSEASDSVSATPSAATAQTAPDEATNLAMTIGDSQLTVTFDRPASNGADVSYALVCSPGDINKVATNGSATATGLTNGTSYSCLIRAIRGSQVTDATLSAAGIPNVAPAKPTISVTIGDGQLNYSFARIGGITYTASCKSGEITESTFSVNGLTNGTSYGCSLTATNSAGSATSDTASATPNAVPGTPTLAVTPANGGLDYSFASATGVTYTASCYTGTIATGSFSVTGLTNGTSYNCSLTATNSAGFATSDSVSGTPRTVPGAPASVSLAYTCGTSLKLTNTAPANNGGSVITSYTATLYKLTNGVEASTATVSKTQSGLFKLDSVSNGYFYSGGAADSATTYRVKVNATNAAGNGAVTTMDATIPGSFGRSDCAV